MPKPLINYYLQTMGIESWVTRRNPTSREKPLAKIKDEVASCQACPLHKIRSQTVFSRGNSQAKLMIIGEAPGFYEDQQGLPFVGKAGILLNQMMQSVGIDDEDVYITNVLKCRLPDNRDPTTEEIEQCSGYLKQQIDLISPVLLLALGRFSGQFLRNKPDSLSQLRIGVHHYRNIPLKVSYHPAYLLQNPRDKKLAYADMLIVKQLLIEKSC